MLNHNYLQVALYKNKTPKSIYEVKTGIACNCICPICLSPLEAKNAGKEWDKPLKPGQKIAHFAHSDGSNCKGASESIIHRVAKEVLKETLSLKLPALHYKGVKLKDALIFNFDSCIKEGRIETDNTFIQPDAILLKNKTELYIEFYKTHLVGESKIEKIKILNKSTIEIDLNEIPILKDGKINKNDIKNYLINSENSRWWLHNNQIDRLYKEHIKILSKDEQKEGVAETIDEQDLFGDFENTNIKTRAYHNREIVDQVKLDKWKNDLKKKGYKSLKIYKNPIYDWDGKRKYFDRMAEKIYCPKKKHTKETVDLFDCERCDYNGKMVKDDEGEWRVVCKFSIEKFLKKDEEIDDKLKGEKLLVYCLEEKYPLIDDSYIQTLMTIYAHLREDMFLLLEKAEKENKKLSIVDDPELEINDQYFLKDIKIV